MRWSSPTVSVPEATHASLAPVLLAASIRADGSPPNAPAHCANCGAPVAAKYCMDCGTGQDSPPALQNASGTMRAQPVVMLALTAVYSVATLGPAG